MELQVVVPIELEQAIQNAGKEHDWTLANNVLYDLCQNNKSQTDSQAIVSKFWLIGRAYSASVERRRTSDEEPLKSGQNFYSHRLVPAYINHSPNFDELFEQLNGYKSIDQDNIKHLMRVHHSLTTVLHSITRQWKRSLASKYLHFHFPDLYFIYDSRADAKLRKFVPKWSRMRIPDDSTYDKYYYKFCLGMIALREAIHNDFGIMLTPRNLDELILSS